MPSVSAWRCILCAGPLEHDDRDQIELWCTTCRRRFIRLGGVLIDAGDDPIPRATAKRIADDDKD